MRTKAANWAGIVLAGIVSGIVLFVVLSGSGMLEDGETADTPTRDDDPQVPPPSRNVSDNGSSSPGEPVQTYIRAIVEEQDYQTAYRQLEPAVRSSTNFSTWKDRMERERKAQAGDGWMYEFSAIVGINRTVKAVDYEEPAASVTYAIRRYKNETEATDPDNRPSSTESDEVVVVWGGREEWKLIEAFNPFF